MYMYVCVYICMYICMYVCILGRHTYIHTYIYTIYNLGGMACFSSAAFSLVLCHALVLLQDCKALRWPFKVVDQGDGAAGIQVV